LGHNGVQDFYGEIMIEFLRRAMFIFSPVFGGEVIGDELKMYIAVKWMRFFYGFLLPIDGVST